MMIFRYCLVSSGIGHVLLLHGAVDNHFALLGSLSMHLGRDGKD